MKHVHHDLIVEWAKDTSKEVQVDIFGNGEWLYSSNPRWDVNSKYRFKPREFANGHWYPCIFSKSKCDVMMMFDGVAFVSSPLNATRWSEDDFKWVGKSLGEIKFGD